MILKITVLVGLFVIGLFAWVLTDKVSSFVSRSPYRSLVDRTYVLKEDYQLIANSERIFALKGFQYNSYLKQVLLKKEETDADGLTLKKGTEVTVHSAVLVAKAVSGAHYLYLLCSAKTSTSTSALFAFEFGEVVSSVDDGGYFNAVKFNQSLPWEGAEETFDPIRL